MKTIVTISVDGDVKQKAMFIIQNDMHSTLSHVINEFLRKIIKKKGDKK